MGGALMMLALAAVSVQYGWQPDDHGGLEYIVQVPAEQLQETGEISSRIDPRVQGMVSRIVVRIGDGPVPRDFGALTPNPISQSQGVEPTTERFTETQIRQAAAVSDIVRGQNSGFTFPNPSGQSTSAGQNALRNPAAPLPSTQPYTGNVATAPPANSALGQYRGASEPQQTGQPSGFTSGSATANSFTPPAGSTNYSGGSWTSSSNQSRGTPSTSPYSNPNLATNSASTGPQMGPFLPEDRTAANGGQQPTQQFTGNNNGAAISTFGNPGLSNGQSQYATGSTLQGQSGYNYGQMTQAGTDGLQQTGTGGPQQTGTNGLQQTGNLQYGNSNLQQYGNSGVQQYGNSGLPYSQNAGSIQSPYNAPANTGITTSNPFPANPGYLGQTQNPSLLQVPNFQQQDSRLLVAANGTIPNVTRTSGDAATTDVHSTAWLLAQQERERTRELQRKNDELEREKAALLTDNRTLIDLDQQNKKSLSEVSVTLADERDRAETMSIFPFFLMVSFLANLYLLVHLSKLLQRYRDLVTSVRTSSSTTQVV